MAIREPSGTASTGPGRRGRMRLLLLSAAVALLAGAPAVARAAPPPNDAFAGALPVTVPSETSASNVDATIETGEPTPAVPPASGSGHSVWYTLTLPDAQPVRIETCGSAIATSVSVYTGTAVDALTEIARADSDCAGGGRAYITTTPGTTYHIRVAGIENQSGDVKLSLATPAPPPNDAFANAIALSMPEVRSGSNIDATIEPGEPNGANLLAHSVWYRLTLPTAQKITIDTCATTIDTVLRVYTGDAFANLTLRFTNDDGCLSGFGSKVTFDALANTTYSISVRGFAEVAGNFTITTAVVPPPPPPPAPPPPPPAALASCPLTGSAAGALGYLGMHSGGGEVCLTATADNSAITSFQIIHAVGDSCFFNRAITTFKPPVPVVGKAFSTAQDAFNGSFDASRGAAGTVQPTRTSAFGNVCVSELLTWTATTTGTPHWLLPPAPPPPPPRDTTPPVLRLSGPKVQRARGALLVRALCSNEGCRARASTTVRGVALKAPARSLQKGVGQTLRLVLTRRARSAIRRAIGSRRSITAKITVKARDVTGNETTAKRTITLRR